MSKIKATLMGALFVAIAGSPAYAISNFTFDPNGGGISNLSNGFTSDNITIKDYAIITIPANPTGIGSISETGALAFTSFDNPTGNLSGFIPGTHTGGGAASQDYQLYIKFTSTS